jgi:hypothetical protein
MSLVIRNIKTNNPALQVSGDLTEVKLSMLIFWTVMQCRLAGRYKRFGGTQWKRYIVPKRWYLCTKLNGVTTGKTNNH